MCSPFLPRWKWRSGQAVRRRGPHLVLGEARVQQGIQRGIEEAAAVGVFTRWFSQVKQQGGVALGQLQELCQAADRLVLCLPVVGGREGAGRPEGVRLAETGVHTATSPAPPTPRGCWGTGSGDLLAGALWGGLGDPNPSLPTPPWFSGSHLLGTSPRRLHILL